MIFPENAFTALPLDFLDFVLPGNRLGSSTGTKRLPLQPRPGPSAGAKRSFILSVQVRSLLVQSGGSFNPDQVPLLAPSSCSLGPGQVPLLARSGRSFFQSRQGPTLMSPQPSQNAGLCISQFFARMTASSPTQHKKHTWGNSP